MSTIDELRRGERSRYDFHRSKNRRVETRGKEGECVKAIYVLQIGERRLDSLIFTRDEQHRDNPRPAY